jgi:hypothetical protein
MLVSDPEKLNAAYENFALDPSAPGCEQPGKTCGIWAKVPDDLVRSKPPMQNAVRHWAAGKFMAATYDVWMVDTSQQKGVGPSDVHTIGCDRGEVAYVPLVSSHHFETWAPFYGMPQEAGYYLRDRFGLTYSDGSPRHGSNIVVLAQGDVSAKPSQTWYGHYEDLPRRFWPPASLMNDLYAPLNLAGVGGGYGWERPWLYSRGQRFVWHGSGWMLQPPIRYGGPSRCYWFAPDRVPG